MYRVKSFSWVVLHTLAILLVGINLLTGLRIATLTHEWLLFFSALLPQGEVEILHFYSGVGLLALFLTYLLSPSLKQAKRDYLAYSIVLSLLSGVALFKDVGFIPMLLELHLLFAFTTLLYIVVHISRHFLKNGVDAFKNISKAKGFKAKEDLKIFSLFILLLIVLYALFLGKGAQHKLYVKEISKAISIDGVLDEEAWKDAKELHLRAYGGANFFNGESDVAIKALSDGDTIFFSFVWRDDTKSINFMPLKKERDAWIVMESGFYNHNETKYYEDKFALILAHTPKLSAAGSVHLGPKPIKERPANWHAKGYHYMSDESIVDMWHWKAVRTNDMFLAEDEFISFYGESYRGKRRYSAGIYSDPKTAGGYRFNWQWYKKGGITPKRLPLNADELQDFQEINATKKPCRANWYDYLPYKKALDNYSAGTYMPSVIYASNNFEGDKADVMAHALWHDGHWHLEMARKLDTGSKYDLAIDKNTYIWVALFDHAQVAHTRHSLPIHLVFGEKQ